MAYRYQVALVKAGEVPSAVRRGVDLLGGMGAFVRPGAHVVIKVNMFLRAMPASARVTHPAVVLEAARLCCVAGGRVTVVERTPHYDLVVRGYEEIEQLAALVALEQVEHRHLVLPGARSLQSPVPWPTLLDDCDVFINIPGLRTHALTRLSNGMKNLMGLLSRDSRRRLHIVGVERGIVALASVLRPRLTVLDALTATSRAVYGEPTPLGVIVAGQDAVAVDHFGCRLLGEDPAHVPHLREAIRQGLGTSLYRVAGDEAVPAPCGGRADSWQERLYRVVFQGMYLLDWPYARLFPGHSCIPAAHYWLGVRPRLVAASCDRCGACVEVCPVGAIDLQRKRIIASRCQRVRCLRCKDVCPREAIVLRGLRRPERM